MGGLEIGTRYRVFIVESSGATRSVFWIFMGHHLPSSAGGMPSLL